MHEGQWKYLWPTHPQDIKAYCPTRKRRRKHAGTERRRWWAPGSFCLRLPPQAADWLNKPRVIFCVQFGVEAWKRRLVAPSTTSLSYRHFPEIKKENCFEGPQLTNIQTGFVLPDSIKTASWNYITKKNKNSINFQNTPYFALCLQRPDKSQTPPICFSFQMYVWRYSMVLKREMNAWLGMLSFKLNRCPLWHHRWQSCQFQYIIHEWLQNQRIEIMENVHTWPVHWQGEVI